MKCPKCGFPDDKVIDSRSHNNGREVRRRRECLDCKHRYSTCEEIIRADLKIVKRNDIREDFSREKLQHGIEKACWKRPITTDDIDKLINVLIQEFQQEYDREISTVEIGNIVMRHLKQLDQVAYVRFASVYRDFTDIDEFISEIRSLGKGKSRK
jgi:transcriptional repressor NrdR